jgi:D-lactate dehydrogenase (cytochrome)
MYSHDSSKDIDDANCLQVRENVDMVKAISKRNKGGEFDFAMGPEEQATLWSARKEALWSMLALRKDGNEVWSTDVAVPLSRLADIIGMIFDFYTP